MFRYELLILLIFANLKLSVAQFFAPYGMLGAYGAPALLNPYMTPMGGLGMGMGYDPLLMSGMGMNLYGNPYLANPYPPLGFTNNGNTFAGYGNQKYGSPMYSRSLTGSPKRFMPGFGCMNRSGCGTGFQKKE